MWRSTSTRPRTASPLICTSMSTRSAFIRSPPIPRNLKFAPDATSSRATFAACRSPDGSPATKRISRTIRRSRCGGAVQGRETLVDLVDDLQRDLERIAAILARHDDRRLSLDRRDEALVLQPQRLTFRRLQLVTLHELLDGLGILRQLRDVESLLQLVELSRASGQIEREITARLEDPDLPQAIPRQPARLDAGDRAALELQPGVGHVHAGQDAGAGGPHVANAAPH